MNELLFIRHAETDLAGTFCGHANPPVNANGLLQIKALASSLALNKLDAIYSSDLLRASTTAKHIAAIFNLSLHETANLREIHFGSWEGMSWTQVEQEDRVASNLWAAEFPLHPAPGGERYEDFRNRVLTITAHLSSLLNYQRIAVVTHGGVMRLVLMDLCGKSSKEAWALTEQYCSSFIYAPGNLATEVLP